ncbi:molybdopterin-dependent oxidoreductase [Desulfatibacillum aliphaticivorans]|uniref:molybdopterin-dependent oxidoreductase n=1 Tax=Desulfatibacillum aliphaticivorans TaxID=218208 RepID=UPI000400B22B|nr:molybdopterin-dependent oxidoreductase [Desulfatibacillum aliphaticivorans]
METKRHYRSCSICESMCGLEIVTRGSEIVTIRGDKNDPLSKGYICAKGAALKDLYNDPDRLRQPVVRTGAGWERVSWDDAFNQAEAGLKAIRKEYGNDALAFYFGNPNAHYHGSLLYLLPFFKAMNTKNRFSASSADQLPLMLVCEQLFGHMFLLPSPDANRTDYFLLIGGNPVVSGGSIMTLPGFGRRMKAIQKRGGKVVVVDPMKTATASLADQHFFIRPGSDVFFLASLLHVMFRDGLADPGWLGHFCDGLDKAESMVKAFSPEKTESVTGVSPRDVEAVAREFCRAPSAVCYGRMGVCVQEHGALVNWLIMLVNIIAGKFDRPGGFMFPTPALDVARALSWLTPKGELGKNKTRVRGLPDFGDEFPVAALAEEIMTPGPGKIRGLVSICGNPILSAPNGKILDQALAELDYMVAMDWYIAESSRHANIILPPTNVLEHDHMPTMTHVCGSHNMAKYSPAVFEPEGDVRHNWQILKELAVRMEANPLAAAAVKMSTPTLLLKAGIRIGPHGAGLNPWGQGLTLKKMKASPHGVDLGPLRSSLPGRLFTKNKRINLVPQIFTDGLEALSGNFSAPEIAGDYDLLLIGRRNRKSNNSWFHNLENMHTPSNRCTAMLNPADAASRGIEEGDVISLESRVGKIELEAEVTSNIMEGVVSVPHGWGHQYKGVSLNVASRRPGVSVNDITDNQRVDSICGTAVFSGVPVKAAKKDCL